MSEKTFLVIKNGIVENVIVAESLDDAREVLPPDVNVVSTGDIPGAWIGSVLEDVAS